MEKIKKKKQKRPWKYPLIGLLLLAPICLSLATGSPEGTSVAGAYAAAENLEFIYDLSYEKDGETVREHTIFQEELDLISQAEEFLVLDLFLFNDEYNREKGMYPNAVEQMADALIAKKKANQEMPVILITDPINNFYGAYEQRHLTRLKEGGVQVVVTDLNQMKDSNPLLSGYYRTYLQWFGTGGQGWIPNFFDPHGPKVTVRSVLKLTNFKGNHRKVLLSEKEGIIASANPHDASSYHSNVAVRFGGETIGDLLESEKAVMAFSGAKIPEITYEKKAVVGAKTDEKIPKMRMLTEEAIFDGLMENIAAAQKDDEIWIGIFYISEKNILEALGDAADRGVKVKIVADPNKDAFGMEKNGNPNRSALCALAEEHEGVEVRWYATKGEQYHGKTAYFRYLQREEARVILGSANFTRRNLRGYNLETDVEISMPISAPQSVEMDKYFHGIWNNTEGEYTLPMEAYYEDSMLKDFMWNFQEKTGLCSW